MKQNQQNMDGCYFMFKELLMLLFLDFITVVLMNILALWPAFTSVV